MARSDLWIREFPTWLVWEQKRKELPAVSPYAPTRYSHPIRFRPRPMWRGALGQARQGLPPWLARKSATPCTTRKRSIPHA